MREENKRKIIVILGQTASGKKKLAEKLIKINDNIKFISADSRKIYKFLDIGTDKPEEEMRKYYSLIDIIEPCTQYSAEDFRQDAEREIENATSLGKIPIVIGGTPLYLLALFEGFFEHKKDNRVREMLNERLKKEGVDSLYRELLDVDPERAKKINPNDAYRIKRALEVYYTTGIPMSKIMKKRRQPKYIPLYFGIKWDREKLYKRINQRVDKMIERGLIEEVKSLLNMGIREDCPGMKTIGYREILIYLKGKITKEDAIRKIKKNTRIYARRQEYFFRHFKGVKWYTSDDIEKLISEIIYNL